MICPGTIDPAPPSKTFVNWARALTFTAAKSYRPTTRAEIVEIIRQAEEAGGRVKWTGSTWSFTDVFVSEDVMVESDGIAGVIDSPLILGRLQLADPALAGRLAHVRGGTKVFNVNRLLHGLPIAANGGGGDESDLSCLPGARALPTLGGSGGQSIAGVMATGSHGGDIHLPPIADCVQAIHLIGPGGQEFWIERTAGLTAGSADDTQVALRAIAAADPLALAELCDGVLVRKDDDLFRAALVSVGRMGFVYALVVRTVPAFKLEETRTRATWQTLRASLTAATFPAFSADKHFVNLLVNPFSEGGQHTCTVSARRVVDCDTPNTPPGPGGDDFFTWVCRQQDVGWIAAILVAAIAVLVVAIVGLVEAISIMLAAAVGFLGVPPIGWIIAAGIFAAIAALAIIIVALAAVIAALVALLGFIIANPHPTPGQIVAAVTNFAFTVGLQDVMRSILVGLFNSAYPLLTKTAIGWKIMDTYGYAADDHCQKVAPYEFAFDVGDETAGGYLAFVDEVLAIFDDLYGRRLAVATLLAIRYTSRTEALLGMSKFTFTCHIEIPMIRDLAGNAEFIDRVQRAARAHGGVPHWGQLMDGYDARDILDLHGADLALWRRQLTTLIRTGGGRRNTFSNAFTMTYNLEPLDDTPLATVRLAVTVGDDSLGDTDWLRHDVSADFAIVTLLDGSVVEVSLNEGAEWRAGSTHERDVAMPAGTVWGDVRTVAIRHQAAGDDVNADNWTMNTIVISAILDTGEVREMFRHSATPIWQFRKNEQQVWQHDFV